MKNFIIVYSFLLFLSEPRIFGASSYSSSSSSSYSSSQSFINHESDLNSTLCQTADFVAVENISGFLKLLESIEYESATATNTEYTSELKIQQFTFFKKIHPSSLFYARIKKLMKIEDEHDLKTGFFIKSFLIPYDIHREKRESWLNRITEESNIHFKLTKKDTEGKFIIPLYAYLISTIIHPDLSADMPINHAFLIMPLATSGNMLSYLKDNFPLSLEYILTFCQKILLILEFLHSNKTFHLDIKPQNILIIQNDDHSADSLRFCDFGFSFDGEDLSDEDVFDMQDKGSLPYASPHILTGRIAREKKATMRLIEESDLWSAGMSMFVIMTNRFPFSPENLRKAVTLSSEFLNNPNRLKLFTQTIPLNKNYSFDEQRLFRSYLDQTLSVLHNKDISAASIISQLLHTNDLEVPPLPSASATETPEEKETATSSSPLKLKWKKDRRKRQRRD